MPTPPPPPAIRTMSLGQVPDYVLTKHRIKVTRQTIYNWTKQGRGGIILKVVTDGLGRRFTTEQWVDTFVRSVPNSPLH